MKQLYLFLLLTANIAFAQLQPFSINVTPTPETCNRNGALSWTINNRTAGSTIIYAIYKLPNQSTAIATTSQTQINGLEAGNYKIVATQTKNNNTNNTSETVTITDNTIPVTYGIATKKELCGNDGEITIKVNSGTAPYEYQILAADNTVLTTQTSPTFTGLAAGTYKIRVNDACGIGIANEAIIQKVNIDLTRITFRGTFECKAILSGILNQAGIPSKYFTFKVSYTNPQSGELVEKETKMSDYSTPLSMDDIFPGQKITYTCSIIDPCGQILKTKDIQLYHGYAVEVSSYTINRDECGNSIGFNINLTKSNTNENYDFHATNINFTTLPEGQNEPLHSYNFTKLEVDKEGLYEGTIEICDGKYTVPFSYNYTKTQVPHTPIKAMLRIKSKTDFCKKYVGIEVETYRSNEFYVSNIEIIDKPDNTDFIYKAGNLFYINNFMPGTYTVRITDSCGNTQERSITIEDFTYTIPEIDVQSFCGGFKLNMTKKGRNYDASTTAINVLLLQIYDESLGGWTTPYTTGDRRVFEPYNLPSDFREIGATFNRFTGELLDADNIKYEGKFRIIKVIGLEDFISEYRSCYDVFKEFEHYSTTIANINSWLCANGTYSVGVGVKEAGNYTYQIVQDRNSTEPGNILVDNGNSHLFTNLTPGTYLFRVLDECGNFSTTEYDITTLGSPQIRTVADCATQELRFVIDGVNYLNFEWYKEGEESTILSTSNVLNLGNFTPAKAGTYKLHLTSPITTACVNEILSVKISEDPFNTPHAGKDSTHALCGDAPVRLGDYLQEANPGEGVDSYGQWERVNTANDAGALVGDQWFANLATPGIYQFNYVVDGLCSGQDVATITLDTRDLVAPTVTQCPSDVTAFSTNDINAVATWNTPTFDDNCKVYVTSNHQPGETFPMGNTTVTYTAEDRGRNTATCKFNVTVNRYTCAKKPNTGAPQGNVKVGISNLNRTTQTTEWINSYNDGWIAMESKTKGFVITRADDVNHPETAIENPVEGMIVFDIDENCIKLYDGTKWACVAQGCNDDNTSNP